MYELINSSRIPENRRNRKTYLHPLEVIRCVRRDFRVSPKGGFEYSGLEEVKALGELEFPFVKFPDFAQSLGCVDTASQHQLYRLTRNRAVPHYRFKKMGGIYFDPLEVDRYFAQCGRKASVGELLLDSGSK